MPLGSDAADVGTAALVDDVTLLPMLAGALETDDVFADALDELDAATPEVVIDEPPEGADVVLPGVDVLEPVDGASEAVDGVCVNSREIPLTPSTDPVCTLEIWLHGVAFVLGGAGA